ncbi:hypothetical protein D4Q76_00455 [archaeon]|nr:MAG: hypothetical protein D4Q76_00455 [archaeon]
MVKETLSYATMAALIYRSAKIEPQYMGKLTGKLVKLRNRGFQHGIFVDRTAGGYFSRTFENYLGCLDVDGKAISRNPVRLNEEGIEACKEVIQNAHKENPEETKKMLRFLGLEKEQICF